MINGNDERKPISKIAQYLKCLRRMQRRDAHIEMLDMGMQHTNDCYKCYIVEGKL